MTILQIDGATDGLVAGDAGNDRGSGQKHLLVIVESPFAGDVERNIRYARAAIAHSLSLGEAPIASHLLYTQPGILDDTVPAERRKGIDAGLAWGRVAELSAVYADLGITEGMAEGIRRAEREGRAHEVRYLGDGW